MGSAMRFDENEPCEDQVKLFADEELLDMWAGMQQISYICEALDQPNEMPFCEPVILNELALRACMRAAARRS